MLDGFLVGRTLRRLLSREMQIFDRFLGIAAFAVVMSEFTIVILEIGPA